MHVDSLATRIGDELSLSDWVEVDQNRVDLFADATDDHQWIHMAGERADAGPFGGPIAHGYLTLSMLPIFLGPAAEFEGVSMQVNYGVNKVRFPHPVPVGSKVRGRVTIESVAEQARGLLLEMKCVVEIEGVDKPACIASPLALLVRDSA